MEQSHPIVDRNKGGTYVLPDYTAPYSPKSYSLDFFSWTNVALGKEDSATPKTHYMLMDTVLEDAEPMLALCHRGFAKSTLLSKNLPLYVASTGELPNFGAVTSIVIFSATYSQSVQLLKDLKAAWLSSDFLQSTLTLATDRTGKTVANKENHLCLQNEHGKWVHFVAFGSGDQIRGRKYPDENGIGHRFELLLFDDILKDEILSSKPARDKLKRWLASSVLPAVNAKHHREIYVGTPMTQDDILMEFLRSKKMKSIAFPIAQKMPAPEDEIVSSWNDLHTPKSIAQSYEVAKDSHTLGDWSRERMLEVVNAELRMFRDDAIQKHPRKVIESKIPGLNVFTSIDLAVSKDSKEGKVAVITIGVDENDHWFVLDIDSGYYSPTETIDILFTHFTKYRFLKVKGEKAALQQVFDHFLIKEQERRKTWFTVGYLTNNSMVSKTQRVWGLEPIINSNKLHVPKDYKVPEVDELLYQLMGYTKEGPTTEFVDLADCLANFVDPNFIFYPTSAGSYDDDDDIDIVYA